MKADNSGIIIKQLAHFIETIYPIETINSIMFIPKGEEGYGYFVKTEKGKDYFLKIQKPNDFDYLTALDAVSDLHFHYKLQYIVAPVRTLDNKSIVEFEGHLISLFPYIKGKSIYETGEFNKNLEQIAKMIADLHNINVKNFDQLPKEKFQNPFENTILKLLHKVEKDDYGSDFYKHKAAELLLKQRMDIEETLEKMKNLQRKLSEASIKFTLTHGDPNFANILRNENGSLNIIDWGEIAIAPIERDLMFFIEVDGKPLDFKSFLSKMNHEIFQFYLYRWCLQEIADYGSQILLQSSKTEIDKHSWIELQPYLPIPHQSIHEKVDEIKRMNH